MFNHIGKYFIATRPWSFTMSLISVSVGTLLAAQAGPISWAWYILTALGITVFHAAANVINDYFDTRYQIDQQDSPTAKYRPQPILSGMLTPHQLLGEAIVLFTLTLVIGMTAAVVLSWHVLWIGVVGFLTSVYYTAGPVKFKYRALGELAVFVIWGPLMIEGAYAVQRQALSGRALIVSIPFGVLVALVLFANNMRDTAYDSRQDVKTLGTILGPRRSYHLFAGLIVLAYAYVLGMIITGIMSFWGLLIFLSVPGAISLLKTFKKEIPDMADALTARFDTIFGILLILAIFLEARVVFSITGAVLLAIACWAVTFGIAWGNFWVKIGLSVTVICLYSFFWQKPKLRFTLNGIIAGIVSAAVLYGLFVLGNFLAPYIIPGAGRQVGGIYDLGTGTDRIFIFLLLCFITGPGEEIFWRGFLQENLMQRYGDLRGYVLGTLIYGGVHLFSLNLMLILAALVAGAFWGILYLWKRDLGLVIVSHSLWSAFIFTVFPVH